jgi:hypothetical protein
MYINPILAGVLGTLLVELVALIIYGFWQSRRK